MDGESETGGASHKAVDLFVAGAIAALLQDLKQRGLLEDTLGAPDGDSFASLLGTVLGMLEGTALG